jgi:hypothetical protein
VLTEKPNATSRPPVWLSKLMRRYRLSSAPWRVLPDFLIIGARKSGTSSLFHYLSQHPGVLPSIRKEPHYFDDPSQFERGELFYRSYFASDLEKKIRQWLCGNVAIGEATPQLAVRGTAERVYNLLPHSRLIVILRNPVDAVYSAYQFGIKMKTYSPGEVDFHQSIAADLAALENGNQGHVQSKFLSGGLYADHLRPWLEIFPPDNFHFVIAEDLFNNPDKVFRSVLEFLGLRPMSLRHYPAINANSYPPMDVATRESLARFFEPHNNKLRQMLGTFPGLAQDLQRWELVTTPAAAHA